MHRYQHGELLVYLLDGGVLLDDLLLEHLVFRSQSRNGTAFLLGLGLSLLLPRRLESRRGRHLDRVGPCYLLPGLGR